MGIKDLSLEEMCTTTERQQFDRKSARIEAAAIAIHIVAFANADGGTLAVGIEDNGEITGIDEYGHNINELLRAPFDFCVPSIRVETKIIDCIDCKNKENHILQISVPQSSELHANQRDEVYYRMGDKSKKLTFEERLLLMYAKGARYYEDEPVYRSSMEDIEMSAVAEYCKKIGYGKTPEEFIRQNKDFIVDANGRQEMSGAAILLFGKDPQQFFKRARVRFIRYDGTEGKFVTEPEYPEFVWKEMIVNAVTHRDYSIKGTDIQIKMFDDHMTVESPGTLPGIVRLNTMRQVHFSRNPKIAELLHAYEYVREFGEGVDRIYNEMKAAGFPEPEYKMESFMLNATIRTKYTSIDKSVTPQVTPQVKVLEFCHIPRKKAEIAKYCGYKDIKHFTKKYLIPLIEEGKLEMTIPEKPNSRNQKYVISRKS